MWVSEFTTQVPFPGTWKSLFLLSGYLQSFFGVYSLRIENVGVRRPPSDDVQIQGVADPRAFRKVFVVSYHLCLVTSG